MGTQNQVALDQRIKRGYIGAIDSIQIIGPFNFNDAHLDAIADQVLVEGKKILAFDLSKSTYVTSPGVASVIKVLKKVRAIQGELFISGATEDMIDVLRLANIDDFIRFR
jgi:anti-anti-sigma regulatory factor